VGDVATPKQCIAQNESGRILIAEGNVNKKVIQVYAAGTCEMLAADLQIIWTQLATIILRTLAYKQQWLESMEAARIRFKQRSLKDSKNAS